MNNRTVLLTVYTCYTTNVVLPCKVLPKHISKLILLYTLTKSTFMSMSMKRCIMLYTGITCNGGIFKAFVFPIFAELRSPSDRTVHHRGENKTKTKKQPHTISSELQYKYRFMHTMKASFPIFNILVSVTTLLQGSVVYMGFFFSTHECQRGNKQKDVLLTANNCCPIPAHLCHCQLNLFL